MRNGLKGPARLFLQLAACSLSLGYVCVNAQTYPTRPIRLILPFPAGGPTDIVARSFGAKLGEALGHQVVLDVEVAVFEQRNQGCAIVEAVADEERWMIEPPGALVAMALDAVARDDLDQRPAEQHDHGQRRGDQRRAGLDRARDASGSDSRGHSPASVSR